MVEINNKLKHLLNGRKIVNGVDSSKVLSLSSDERCILRHYLHLINDNYALPCINPLSRRYEIDLINNDIIILKK